MPRPLVLVIDDNRDARHLMAMGLRMLYDVAEAADGIQGLDRLRRLRPTVAIVDLRMPGINGLDLCAHVRADPELRDTLLVIVTGATAGEDINDEVWLQGTDADAFLSKPFEPSALVAKVQVLLERRMGYVPPPPGTGSYD